MSALWTWSRLCAAVTALELPTDQYVVGLEGALLANESIESAPEVVLLATDELHDELKREGWPTPPGGVGLRCPNEPGLVVLAGDLGSRYSAPIAELMAGAWHEDDVPVVSMLQIDPTALKDYLAQQSHAVTPAPEALTWTWTRLRDAVAALQLPRDDYVVGLAGALLANDSLPSADLVDLLVTDALCDDLVRRGWLPGADGVLMCPVEDNLVARSGDLGDTYLADVATLAADAWVRDDLPLVSMMRVRREAVQAALA